MYEKVQEQINPESSGTPRSTIQVTGKQPVVSLKSKSVSVHMSLITSYGRKRGHAQTGSLWYKLYSLQETLASDFYSTGRGCQQSCHARQRVTLYIPELSIFAGRPCFFCTRNPTSTASYFLSLSMFALPHFQEAMQREGYNITPFSLSRCHWTMSETLHCVRFTRETNISGALRVSPKMTSIPLIYCYITNYPQT